MKSWLIGKDSDAGRNWGQKEKGTTEDEMAGWHHWLNGRESEWTLGVGDGQGGLACCDSWGRKESDTTERLISSDVSDTEDSIVKQAVRMLCVSLWHQELCILFEMASTFVQQWAPSRQRCWVSLATFRGSRTSTVLVSSRCLIELNLRSQQIVTLFCVCMSCWL